MHPIQWIPYNASLMTVITSRMTLLVVHHTPTAIARVSLALDGRASACQFFRLLFRCMLTSFLIKFDHAGRSPTQIKLTPGPHRVFRVIQQISVLHIVHLIWREIGKWLQKVRKIRLPSIAIGCYPKVPFEGTARNAIERIDYSQDRSPTSWSERHCILGNGWPCLFGSSPAENREAWINKRGSVRLGDASVKSS